MKNHVLHEVKIGISNYMVLQYWHYSTYTVEYYKLTVLHRNHFYSYTSFVCKIRWSNNRISHTEYIHYYFLILGI